MFIVIWNPNGNAWCDENVFSTQEEAVTYAQIETQQMEMEGMEFKIYQLSEVKK